MTVQLHAARAAEGSPPGRIENILATAKGGGFLAGGNFFEFGVRFVIALLLARLLGPADYGLYVLAISAAVLFSGISQLGLDDAMVRYVAILSGRDDRSGTWGAIQIGLGVSTAVAVVLGAVLYAAAQPVAETLFDQPDLTPSLRFVAALVPFLAISNVLAGVARGFGRMDYAAFAENVVMSLVRLGLLAAFFLIGELDLFVAVVIFGISDIVASLTLLYLVNQEIPIVGILRKDVRRDVGAILRFALPLWMSGVLRQFRRNIETFLLGALAAASSVGIFAVVGRINLVGHVFLLSILLAVKPILARLHDRRDQGGLQHIYRTSTRWALTLNVPFFLVMVLYPEPILMVFGEAFGAGATALIILSFAELVNAATGICGPMIDMTGHVRVKLFNSVLWTFLTITSSAVLIPRWGVVGAAAAVFIAMVVVNVLCVLEVWILERLVPFDRTLWKPTAAALAALGAGLILNGLIPVGTSFTAAAVEGSLVCGIYLGLLLLFGLAAEDREVLRRALERARLLFGRTRAAPAQVAEKVG